jgi:D-glycero-alpha-D-manno-heptose-7-phosphate kinase
MGAGGGGFFMFFCPGRSKQRVRTELTRAGLRELPYDFDYDGAKVMLNV